MPNYQLGKIYKIIDNTTGKVYYGSTIEPTLAKRLAKHTASFKSYKQGKSDICRSYELFENGDYTIILVELFPCDSRDELLMRERFYIDNNECVNKKRPITTIEEKEQYQEQYHQQYYQEHKEEINQKHQQYYQEHKKEINQKHQQYYQEHTKQLQKITCECGRVICEAKISRHKKSKIHNELMNSKE